MLREADTVALAGRQQRRGGVPSARVREAFRARGGQPGGHSVRVLITMPWGHRLGGAEAMLQTVLDGARESGHELELVFCEAGPWPDELRGSRLSRRGAGGRAPARHPSLDCDSHPPRPDPPSPPARPDPQLVGEDAAVRGAGGRAGGDVRSRCVVAARDPKRATGSTAARPRCRRSRSAAPRRRSPVRRRSCRRRGRRSSSPPAHALPAVARGRAMATRLGPTVEHQLPTRTRAFPMAARPSTSQRTCRSSASSGAWSRGRARIECSAPRRCCASGGTACTP